MSINSVNISGNLTKDCEVRRTANKDVIRFSVAVNDRVNVNGEWQDRANFVDCDYWVTNSDKLAKSLMKGAKVALLGKLRQNNWEKDGQKFSKLTVTVQQLEFMSAKKEGRESGGFYDSDIPF